MSRHAKNNTASSCFTAHEKQQLKYGTVKQRLGKESFRDFNCCSLCLKIVTDPHACHKGHLYCKECIFQNLLTQKKAIKRLNQLYEQQEQEQQVIHLIYFTFELHHKIFTFYFQKKRKKKKQKKRKEKKRKFKNLIK